MRRAHRPFVALSLALGLFSMVPREARAVNGEVRWPAASPSASAALDPLAPLRWSSAREGWTATYPARREELTREFEAAAQRAGWSEARLLAGRAVLARLYRDFAQARGLIERAGALDATALDDPDVTLTRAYLAAQQERWEEAVTILRSALPRLGGNADQRIAAILEGAHWSMARGPAGLPEALSLLREASALRELLPMVRATLALALFRAGSEAEAREVASGGQLPQAYSVAAGRRAGTLAASDSAVAVGTALWLSGNAAGAVEALTNGGAPPAAWRAQAQATLAAAQRGAPARAAQQGAGAQAREQQYCGRDAQGRPRPCPR